MCVKRSYMLELARRLHSSLNPIFFLTLIFLYIYFFHLNILLVFVIPKLNLLKLVIILISFILHLFKKILLINIFFIISNSFHSYTFKTNIFFRMFSCFTILFLFSHISQHFQIWLNYNSFKLCDHIRYFTW